MPSPLVGGIAFGFLVVVLLPAGVLLLVNARRIAAWLEMRNWPGWLRKPGTTEVLLTGALWTVIGLFSIGGVAYWGLQL